MTFRTTIFHFFLFSKERNFKDDDEKWYARTTKSMSLRRSVSGFASGISLGFVMRKSNPTNLALTTEESEKEVALAGAEAGAYHQRRGNTVMWEVL